MAITDYIDLLVRSRQYKLKSGRIITVKRAGVGFFGQLLMAVQSLASDASENYYEVLKNGLKDEIQNADKIKLEAAIKNEWINEKRIDIERYLSAFVDGNYKDDEILEVMQCVFELNTVSSGGDGDDLYGWSIDWKIKAYEDGLRRSVAFLAMHCGYKPHEVYEMDNVTVYYLIHEVIEIIKMKMGK